MDKKAKAPIPPKPASSGDPKRVEPTMVRGTITPDVKKG